MVALFGVGTKYILQELPKISDIPYQDTEEDLVYNLPNMTENENYHIEGRKFNWEKLYGKLEKRRICICFK